MNLTPQSMRSPVSPYDQQPKQPFAPQRPCYPTTPQPEQSQNRGLGLFGCGLQQPQSTVHELPPSPQPSDGWSHSSMMEQEFPQSSQPPDIFTAAYDPFSGFPASPNTGMISGSPQETPGLVFCQTPPRTELPSNRSSVSSSYPTSEAYSQHGSEFIYTPPKVKVEEPGEWYTSNGNDQVLRRNQMNQQCLSPYSTGVSPISGPGDDTYRTQAEWAKPSAPAYPIALQSSDDSRLPQMDGATVPSSLNRMKKKRQRTTPEEATHECRVCGKLFKRSYNWKSHMETHNPDRKYPHPCIAKVGDTPCTKKFQRKTDLDRHVDSVSFYLRGSKMRAPLTKFTQVHLKAKNHRCSLCGNRFARRDTLRRHAEDGCQKRFEVGFRDGSGIAAGRWPMTNFPARNRSYSLGGVPQQLPGVPISSGAPSGTFPVYNRPGLVGS